MHLKIALGNLLADIYIQKTPGMLPNSKPESKLVDVDSIQIIESTIRTAAVTVTSAPGPNATRFHTESREVSRRLDKQIRTVADDVGRRVPGQAPPRCSLRQPSQ
jgi:hypothetical protein